MWDRVAKHRKTVIKTLSPKLDFPASQPPENWYPRDVIFHFIYWDTGAAWSNNFFEIFIWHITGYIPASYHPSLWLFIPIASNFMFYQLILSYSCLSIYLFICQLLTFFFWDKDLLYSWNPSMRPWIIHSFISAFWVLIIGICQYV